MLPGGIVATGEFLYNRDINGMYYINANLPAAQSQFVGSGQSPAMAWPDVRRVGSGWRMREPHQQRGGQSGDRRVRAQEPERRPVLQHLGLALMKTLHNGLAVRGGYSYGLSKDTHDPGSTAVDELDEQLPEQRSEQPRSGRTRTNSPGNRVFVSATYTKQYFGFGSTTISAFFDGTSEWQYQLHVLRGHER